MVSVICSCRESGTKAVFTEYCVCCSSKLPPQQGRGLPPVSFAVWFNLTKKALQMLIDIFCILRFMNLSNQKSTTATLLACLCLQLKRSTSHALIDLIPCNKMCRKFFFKIRHTQETLVSYYLETGDKTASTVVLHVALQAEAPIFDKCHNCTAANTCVKWYGQLIQDYMWKCIILLVQ